MIPITSLWVGNANVGTLFSIPSNLVLLYNQGYKFLNFVYD